jgi:hypothetical protein
MRYVSLGPSPREILTGARARGDLDFRCSFGDFALTTVPQTTNSPTARRGHRHAADRKPHRLCEIPQPTYK